MMTNDYQRFFIQNSGHIGAYEEMCRVCPEPWNIHALGLRLRLDMRAALAFLECHRPACAEQAAVFRDVYYAV